MQVIKHDININFVGWRKLALIFSLVLIVVGMGSLVVKGGPNYGIDFSGGTLIQVKFTEATKAAQIKSALKEMDMKGLLVQNFEGDSHEFLLRAQDTSSELEGLADEIRLHLEKTYGEGTVEIRRVEMVGPQVGKDLRKKGLLAIVFAMVGVLIYITIRFEFKFAVGAIIALLHDVLITLGAFSLFNKEIDLPIIAAFLAIIGYSLNDTIIVYDRIRENCAKSTKEEFPTRVNASINETLSRTILTSGTTLLVILALFLFGGGVIHNFAFAMLVGVVVGTYSSIFVASPVLLFWDDYKNRKQAAVKAP
ncbi:protein export membrane protein SecF [Syntrophotalea carbinolica DSM 2380]|uniref:Protein-export membrane protein SecF n=1 Tax=Syntrophotalea carbinolica (strain DSM 2380 / NBRC 103641 / GraBd1) TaxID=338963 RepID=Q3A3C5_SYNC1|nr:protein translocase subunit SecF [Syntrophotalea carbinolica]ABA89132.1 protein export membrane protein SecF [Syntrophotalea carbinolica DSM 2380]